MLIKGVTDDTTQAVIFGVICVLFTLTLTIKGSAKARNFEMYEMSSPKYQYVKRRETF